MSEAGPILRNRRTVCTLLCQVVDYVEVVMQFGVIDGRVAEFAFAVDLRSSFDQVLHNWEVIVHGCEMQGGHPKEIFCVLKLI